MSESTIGIKIANGSFYPILDEDAVGKKKLVLTTVNDNQASVQIDLYRGTDPDAGHDSYLGSLIVENVPESPRGEPEIELLIGIDEDGNVNATATESQSGEKQSLSVSLKAIAEEELYEVPDFELDEQFEPEFREEPETASSEVASIEEEIGMVGGEEQFSEEGFGPAYDESIAGEEGVEPQERSRKVHPLLLVGFILLGLLIIGLIAFLLFRSFQGPAVPPLEAEKTVESGLTARDLEEEPPGAEPSEAPSKGGNEEAITGTAEKKTAEKSAEAGKSDVNGVWYTIRWGDTLWDISQSFYRTPWLYKKIAAWNNIKNPDLIFAGKKIFIPER